MEALQKVSEGVYRLTRGDLTANLKVNPDQLEAMMFIDCPGLTAATAKALASKHRGITVAVGSQNLIESWLS